MAFNDIRHWASIMESQEQDRKNWDAACEAAEARYSKMLQEEFDDLDQESIDPDTLGLREPAFRQLPEFEQDLDEKIDFSQYGVCEADAREPITAAAAALGCTASTATLVGQDTVVLKEDKDETLERIAAALEKIAGRGGLGGAAEMPDDMGSGDDGSDDSLGFDDTGDDSAEDESSDSDDDADEDSDEDSEDDAEEDSEDSEKDDDSDDEKEEVDETLFDRMLREANEAGEEAGEEASEEAVASKKEHAPDYPLTDEDWQALLDKPHDEIIKELRKIAIRPGLSKEARAELQDDIKNVRLDAFNLKKRADGMKSPADFKSETTKTAADYPISDDEWKELIKKPYLEQMKRLQQAQQTPGLSDEAKKNLEDDLKNLENDIVADNSQSSALKRVLALQRTSRDRDLTKGEVEEFTNLIKTRLTPEQRELVRNIADRTGISKGFRHNRVFISPKDINRTKPISAGGTMTAGDDDDDDMLDPELAALDTQMAQGGGYKFKAPKPGEIPYVDMGEEPGFKEYQYDPNYVSIPRRKKEINHDIEDFEKYVTPYIPVPAERKNTADAAVGRVTKDGEVNFTDNPIEDFLMALNGIPSGYRNELKQELLAAAESQDEKDMIERIWQGYTRKQAKLTKQEINALASIGTDQKGRTGAGTQWTDKWIDQFLLVSCESLNIDAEDAELMRKYLRGSTPEAREIRKKIRPRMLQEIADELGLNIKAAAVDPQHDSKRRKPFMISVIFCLATIIGQATPEEKEEIRTKMTKFYKDTRVRKLKTKLDGAFTDKGENAEFRDLIAKERDNPDSMTDDDIRRLWELEFIRKGVDAEQAKSAAATIVGSPDQKQYDSTTNTALTKAFGKSIWKKGELAKSTSELMKRFLRGGSGNANI